MRSCFPCRRMATRQLRVVALLVALPALLGVVGACGTLIGIEDLGVDQASTTPDGGKRTETGAPIEEPPPDAPTTGDVDTSVPPPPDGATPAKRVFVTSSATTAKLDNHPGVTRAARRTRGPARCRTGRPRSTATTGPSTTSPRSPSASRGRSPSPSRASGRTTAAPEADCRAGAASSTPISTASRCEPLYWSQS